MNQLTLSSANAIDEAEATTRICRGAVADRPKDNFFISALCRADDCQGHPRLVTFAVVMAKANDNRYSIRPLDGEDLVRVKSFCDEAIGENYYSLEELKAIFAKSKKDQMMCSFILEDASTQKIHGVRITYPPGNWSKGKGQGLSPDLWQKPLADVAYFQSLFIGKELAGQGWGSRLSLASIEALKALGAKAIVTHSWKESPNDSSGKYLRGLGFQTVAVHPLYWKDVDYNCTRCLKPPCQCTAEEMIKYL